MRLPAFLSRRPRRRDPAEPLPGEGTVAVLVFADIVSSTSRIAAIGDLEWRALLDEHRGEARAALARFGGAEVDATGDELFARFGSASAALAFASVLRETAAGHGLTLRIGLHAGECAILDGKPCGLAVHVAARVAAAAEPDAILATGTVRALVLGWPIVFDDRGERTLRAVPGSWRLYEVGDRALSAAA